MRVVDTEPHAWFLLTDDDTVYLDVSCNHHAFGYSVLIALEADELARYRAEGRSYLDVLASDIQDSAPAARGSRSPYRSRDLTRPLRGEVTQAVRQWRAGP